eukprot:CAMPEP_0184322772 /NCGR_PEP_ID=MMETSP1049-20130417/126496_1 /TAXON_ID=77928 /ORGANISM="Proteomonas sulcata, Strain CCMP704" /LENGTH=94 /DNA_ID=CAMNT_0026644023 /DNA_START=141 /DNA_END=423 /DNA_ORIENTATION=-
MRGQLLGLAEGHDEVALKASFEKFDTDGSGYLDADELRVALRETRGCDVSLDEVTDLINSVDCVGDGVISYEEFLALHDELDLITSSDLQRHKA